MWYYYINHTFLLLFQFPGFMPFKGQRAFMASKQLFNSMNNFSIGLLLQNCSIISGEAPSNSLKNFIPAATASENTSAESCVKKNNKYLDG